MKKFIILTALAFTLAVGTVTVMTVHPQQAMAYPCPNFNCAIDEPVVTNPQRAPEPAPFQMADCSSC